MRMGIRTAHKAFLARNCQPLPPSSYRNSRLFGDRGSSAFGHLKPRTYNIEKLFTFINGGYFSTYSFVCSQICLASLVWVKIFF